MISLVTIDHDPCPDYSWLKQSIYDPMSPDYEPTYESREAFDADRPLDPYYYRDPNNHVTLLMWAYDEDDILVDSCGGIDFLECNDDWTTGTFGSLKELDRYPYLRELAAEMGLR